MKYKYLSLSLLFFSIIAMSAMCQDDIETNQEVDQREYIEGKWHAEYSDDGLPVDYEIEISMDAENDSKIIMKNFFNTSEDAYALMTGNALTIPSQSVGSQTVEGDGSVQDDHLRIDFQITVDDVQYSISAVPGTVTKKQEN